MVLVLVSISIRDQFGEPWPKRGPSPKNRDFWDIKLKIFGNKGAENSEKFRGFKKIQPFFVVLRANLAIFGKFWETF